MNFSQICIYENVYNCLIELPFIFIKGDKQSLILCNLKLILKENSSTRQTFKKLSLWSQTLNEQNVRDSTIGGYTTFKAFIS